MKAEPPRSSAPKVTRSGIDPVEDVLGGGVRGEVAGCPTGLAADPQAQAAQQPGGGGAPGTGQAAETADS